MRFADLRLADPILRAVEAEGYSTATPIQAQAIPHVLEGRDVLGSAQTGTGKTAAFSLPILHRLSLNPSPTPRRARCLVLAPTRELASQIQDSFRAYGRELKLRSVVIFGGVNQNPQVDAVYRGCDILIATPGRLLDLINQGHIDLSCVEHFVLDEADRMLDMGFIHDIRKIVAMVPADRQTLMFSATMPPEIRKLADTILHKPVTVSVAPVAKTADRIEQSVYFVEKGKKPALLAHLINELNMFRTIVFTRTKHGADKVVRRLHASGIRAEALHGNKTQNARKRALENFISSRTPVLVATDIASRGIDVDNISHVVNYDLTHEPETYVHRIGRTARAGASGQAISFCDRDEVSNLKAIEALIKQRLTRAETPAVIVNAPREAVSAEPTEQRHQHQQQRMHAQPPRRSERPSHGHPAHPRRPVHPSAIDRDGSRQERTSAPAPAKPAASGKHFVGGGVKAFGTKSFGAKSFGGKSFGGKSFGGKPFAAEGKAPAGGNRNRFAGKPGGRPNGQKRSHPVAHG